MGTYSIISAAQLETIRGKINVPSEDTLAEERKRLKQLSDERAGRWPNTLSAQRSRKEKARVERLAAEENERVEVDRQEAELRAEQRRIQIERANKMLFDQTDRVKGFHGKMLLCDVLQENAELIEYKKQIDVLKRAQEQAFVEQQTQQLEAATAAELAKFEETRRKAFEQRDVQLQQLEETKRRILSSREDNKREGELLRRKAEEEALEMRRKEADRAARARQNNMEAKKANDVLLQFKAQEQQRQKEQEAAIESYSRKKAELLAERERREAEKRAAKEAEKKRIADRIEETYRSFAQKEEERLSRDVLAAEAKAVADEVARRQRIKDSLAAMDKTNRAQLQQKTENKAREREKDLDYVMALAARMQDLRLAEEAERREVAARNRQVADFQLRQAAIRARQLANAKIAALEEAAQLHLSLQEQDDIFQAYAAECIREYQRQGKPTLPMELHLRKKETLETMNPM